MDAACVTMDPGGKPSTAQLLLLATSSTLTAVFYTIYKSKATTVARLKVSLHSSSCGSFGLPPLVGLIWSSVPQEAKKVSIDQDLKGLLSETPGRCVPYAVIEGGGDVCRGFFVPNAF